MPAVRRLRPVLALLVVAALSSLSACTGSHPVRSTPAPTSSPDRRPANPAVPLPAKHITADGDQLRAAAPLKNVKQDQGSSIPLPDGRTLWIFADTFQLGHQPAFFVTSSAAVTDPGSWRLRYSLGNTAGSKRYPSEFLPRTAAERSRGHDGDDYIAVWPTGSTLLPNGRVLIAYAKYHVWVQQNRYVYLGGGLYSFAYRGAKRFAAGDHAKRIADDLWTADDGEVRSPVYADGWVYFVHCASLRCYSLRTTPDGLTRKGSYTWWTGSGWSADRSQRRQISVATNHPGGNPSIVRLRNGVYAMADTEAGVASSYGWFWVAPHPWGPWSRASSFRMTGCPARGCYGLNLHPQDSGTSYLRVSYATGGSSPVVKVDDVPVRMDTSGGWVSVR